MEVENEMGMKFYVCVFSFKSSPLPVFLVQKGSGILDNTLEH